MTVYNENLGKRIRDLLNFQMPMFEKCTELAILFDRGPIRDLQEVFPIILQSIFGIGTGGLGWGLRATCKENAFHIFNVLREFFSPQGPMMRLCYRLLNEAIKFEFKLDMLPHKVADMMVAGQQPLFYADLVNLDNFRRQVESLSLNAFDYYILHFVIHATFPLHKMFPAALQVHNERLKTVYFYLTADYLCQFLPSSPDSVVLPTNICPTVKTPQPMPVQPLQPKRSPKYLKIPNTNLYSANNTNTPTVATAHNTESPRAHSWRTESVLHFFVDIWFRYDVDDSRDLPSSEFIRVVRILVKQVHTFANSAHLDQTAMVTLRKIAQPMLRSRIYPFLKSLIARWPLDNSMFVILELWLSYIQPWRYAREWHNAIASMEVPISNRFDSFIADNLIIYTQIFVHILPRFERLDFTSHRNVIMLHRFVKVFCQTTLPRKLYQAEQAYVGLEAPQYSNSSYLLKKNIMQNASIGVCEWNTLFHEEIYTPMFGSAVKTEVEQFIKTVYISLMYVQQEIQTIYRELHEKKESMGFFKKHISSLFEDTPPEALKLQEIVKIPEILNNAIRELGTMFNIDVPNISVDRIESCDQSSSSSNFSSYDSSGCLDVSKVTPTQMMNNLSNITARIDPAVLPIETHECNVLVRFLHQVSCRLNEMFGEEMQIWWNRTDFWGKLTRQILYPPMTAQWFQKSKGVNELCEDHLPARICLRTLASYQFLTCFILSMVIGQIMWGAPSFGLLTFLLLFVIYFFILALIS